LVVTAVTRGSAGGVISTDGSRVYYTPRPGFVGVETFGYTVSAGGRTAATTATVFVVPPLLWRTLGLGEEGTAAVLVDDRTAALLNAIIPRRGQLTPFGRLS
jgi:hypothetical protein